MATPFHCRRFLSLPLTIRERESWMKWLIIVWMIIVIVVPLIFFKFVIHIGHPFYYILYAVIVLVVTLTVFLRRAVGAVEAEAEVAAASAMATASTSASRPRRSVDVAMEVFDYSISKDEVEDDCGQLCIICLCDYEEDGQPALSLPVCRHNFHVACIQRWLECHNRCPVCSTTPVPSEPASQTRTDVVRVSVVVPHIIESTLEERGGTHFY
ncbi:hypothetical protein SUGI_0765740 [Cryptomeria japonica]|uniref:probable E3 ubiquitin-protein ligase RHA4A n=1 Tax=Cryptomeria japonica TaxID=3369 RepID=UPI0024147C81|nr:probable E3 ubiquitin-protein ligase RHA4A [Cryptomeria japonica]GLJ37698.1 hypothetical protein SUGI_0765740 [Cryptomeria japonica]